MPQDIEGSGHNQHPYGYENPDRRVLLPQSATLDGKTVGVAPGLRLFGTDNQLLPIAAVAGQKLPVRFKLDLYGQLLTAWVLTEQEQKAAQ